MLPTGSNAWDIVRSADNRPSECFLILNQTLQAKLGLGGALLPLRIVGDGGIKLFVAMKDTV
jgi:hypothetical protein